MGERHISVRPADRTGGLPFKVPQLRNLHEKLGLDYSRTNSRAGFGFTHDGRQDTLSKFLFFGSTDPVRYFRAADPNEEGVPLDVDRNIADLIAFLFCFSGRDPAMNPFFRDSIADSQDVAAGTGRQFTATTSNAPLFEIFLRLADSPSNRLDLIVRGRKGGVDRGWYYAGHFISDRVGEELTLAQLASLPSAENPLTFTLVPRGSGRRLGIDRDNDGWPDRTEIEAGFDPADPDSRGTAVPPQITLTTNYLLAHAGTALTFSPAVTDPDTPEENLSIQLLPDTPPGATIDPASGLLNWPVPPALRERRQTRVYVRVMETTWPFHSDIEALTLEPVPFRLEPIWEGLQQPVFLRWQTIAGRTYQLQYTTNLSQDIWTDWFRPVTGYGDEAIEREDYPFASPRKFYRLRLEPLNRTARIPKVPITYRGPDPF